MPRFVFPGAIAIAVAAVVSALVWDVFQYGGVMKLYWFP